MRITKLHLLLIFIAAVVAGFYYYQIRLDRLRQTERAAAAEVERMRAEEETRRAADLEKKRETAVNAVAVAGEYHIIARKEGRDATRGQETLREAKDSLALQDYDTAIALARQAITLFKEAPPSGRAKAKPSRAEKRYTVRRGDSLWGIARMPEHYGRGALWVTIWRANEKQIPDFDVIYPRQVLVIPRAKTHQSGALTP